MTTIRPVTMADLDALVDLASLAGVGLTTLPRDRDFLRGRIQQSLDSFESIPSRPGGEGYLFVMEDAPASRIVGACGVFAKVGGYQPFYAYRIEQSLFESKWINVRREVPILHLVEMHDGPCEIGSLFLHPDCRKSGNGRFLQLVRFLFIAEHPQAFEEQVVSELRGVCAADGHSPFWDAIGRHFFGIDFQRADYLSIVNKRFIADLMPDHPIYIPLLPESAQQVIGRPHDDGRRALKNLEEEGFAFTGMVDIFDGGPLYGCRRDEIRAVRESRRLRVGAIVPEVDDATEFMVGTTGADFRACRTPLRVDDRGITLPAAAAEALRLRFGDAVRFVPLLPRTGSRS